MRVVFMGTPQLAATVLERLASEHEIVGVFTRPDAVRGRGSKTVPSPVKETAVRLGVPVFERTSLKGDEATEAIRSLRSDVICVAAYGIILPKEVLETPKHGCLNVHTSLLPRWRGAAPIERAILSGDEMTGACVMRMEEGLDTGDYCRRVEVPVGGLYIDELSDLLARRGSEELLAAIDEIGRGDECWHAQGVEGIVYAEKIGKGELALCPQDTAKQAAAKVRASSPAHPARVMVADRTMAVERAQVVEDEDGMGLCAGLAPGEARFGAKRLFLQTSEGALELLQVRPDGKKSMDARSFAGGIQGIKKMALTWGRA